MALILTKSGGRRLNEFQLCCNLSQVVDVFQSMEDTPVPNLISLLFPGFRSIDMNWIRAVKAQEPISKGLEWKIYLLAMGVTLS
jgi:hypothetical protein